MTHIYPSVDPVCSRCQHLPCTLVHMLWLRPVLETFLKSFDIFKSFNEISGLSIDLHPLKTIFGVGPDDTALSNNIYSVIAFTAIDTVSTHSSYYCFRSAVSYNYFFFYFPVILPAIAAYRLMLLVFSMHLFFLKLNYLMCSNKKNLF